MERLSDELYDQLMEMAKKHAGLCATQWIHIADAVDKGSISPIDAHDAIILGYCPEHLTVRDSRYKHLL